MTKSNFLKKTLFLTFIIICIFLLPVKSNLSASEPKNSIEHIILISIDGLNYEGFIQNPTPNLDWIAKSGVIDEKAISFKANTIEEAEASLITSTLSYQHKHYSKNDPVDAESFFDLLKKNKKSYFIVDASEGRLSSFSHAEDDYVKIEEKQNSEYALSLALENMKQNKPFFTYIFLNDTSLALKQLDAELYQKNLQAMDKNIGDFIKGLKNIEVYDNSLIIITSAKSSSPSNYVPLIINSPNTKINKKIENTMLLDIIPTICHYVNLKKPYHAKGLILYETFNFESEKLDNIYPLWIEDMKKERSSNWKNLYLKDDEINSLNNLIESIKKENESIFDFVGEREYELGKLKVQILVERITFALLLMLLGIGYVLEYCWLKRKFLLFK